MHIKIKKLDSSDVPLFESLIGVFENVFEMKRFTMPAKEYLLQLLQNNGFFVFVALLEDKVVGGLTSYVLPQYYSQSSLMYIYDLAVKTEFQRKGIGKMLISGITNYCKERGVAEAFVQADEADDYALDFYHSTGAIAQKVVQFVYPIKG